MDYITVRQAAEKWNVTPRWVQALVKRGSIDGVIRFGDVWMIPKDAQKPPDGRVNNRRQPKKEKTEQREGTAE
jgi:hypothetical protein